MVVGRQVLLSRQGRSPLSLRGSQHESRRRTSSLSIPFSLLPFSRADILLLQKKPVRLSGPIKEHQWSPADNYLAVYIPENNNIPAKVVVIEAPSQKVIAQTTLFNVTGVPFLLLILLFILYSKWH